MSILVLGSNGQLGKCLIDHYSNEDVLFLKKKDLDILDETKLAKIIKNYRPKFVINCSAYTKVEMAEIEHETAELINSHAVSNISELCKQTNSILIHISTDYVFDGKLKRPFTEEDVTNPLNIYGKTKLAGEKAIQKILPTDAIIIRVGWMYSEYGNNFVKTMLRLGKEKKEINIVNDQFGSPTYARDLAEVILQIMNCKNFKKKNQITEIYHYSNEGKTSWYKFAKEIFKIKNINCKINPILSEYYETLARRPKFSLMNRGKIIKNFKIKKLDFRKSLKSCLKNLK